MSTGVPKAKEEHASAGREEPRVVQAIAEALGQARTVINVGAAAGCYEPRNVWVLAVEPSDALAAKRSASAAPALRARAHELPLRDNAVDAALSVMALPRWDKYQELGVREMRRVASGPVVLLTCDAEVCRAMWLFADYLPQASQPDAKTFPNLEQLDNWLGGGSRVVPLPIPSDTPDRSLLSFWAHPERVLDADMRNQTSEFARMPASVVMRVVDAVRQDLAKGAWDARYGHLRSLAEFDAGLRLVVSAPGLPDQGNGPDPAEGPDPANGPGGPDPANGPDGADRATHRPSSSPTQVPGAVSVEGATSSRR